MRLEKTVSVACVCIPQGAATNSEPGKGIPLDNVHGHLRIAYWRNLSLLWYRGAPNCFIICFVLSATFCLMTGSMDTL